MKSFGIFIVTLFLIHCATAQNQADKVGAECAKKFTLPQSEKDDLANGNFDKISPEGKCYVDCFSKGMNFMTNGAVNEPTVIAFYTSVLPKITPETIKGAISKCATAITGANDCEKSFNVHKCIYGVLNA